MIKGEAKTKVGIDELKVGEKAKVIGAMRGVGPAQTARAPSKTPGLFTRAVSPGCLP
jgi:hypothetical protein